MAALALLAAVGLCGAAACSPARPAAPRPGDLAYERSGDEIMVCGQLFRTGTPVVLWTDPGGYDAYRVERRFGPIDKSGWAALQAAGRGPGEPARYGGRFFRFAAQQPAGSPLSDEEIARFRGGGWDLASLRRVVDQFVLHYDVCGTSKVCFRVLHDVRGLSVHFMLDIDGTIYQTMDLKERGFHATTSNDRSAGIEIANMGAYDDSEANPFERWYARDESGRTRITIPEDLGDGGVRTPGFVGRPMRDEPVTGEVQGRRLRQYDLTPQQYDALIKLTAALGRVFPNMPLDYPRDAEGRLVTRTLEPEALRNFRGVLGHFHIQDDKVDPGPALQWDVLIEGARDLVGPIPGRTPVS